MSGTGFDAFPARCAFALVNMGQERGYLRGLDGAYLAAFRAAYARYSAFFHGYGSAVAVCASHPHHRSVGMQRHELAKTARTRLHAFAASGAFLEINAQQGVSRRDRHGAEGTCCDTIPACETAVDAIGFTLIERGLNSA